MGLNIYHYRIIDLPEESDDFIRIDDWDDYCNLPLKCYKNYIKDIEDIELDKYILMVKDEKALEKMLLDREISKEDILEVIFGNPNREIFEKYLEEYIKSNKIENIGNKIITEYENMPPANIKNISVASFKKITVKGLYYKEIGYQRKNMGDNFYELFKNKYIFFGKKEDFDLAYDCVCNDDWYLEHFSKKDIIEIRKEFKENFVDKYIFGNSIMFIDF